ncbi:unnamed protein product [Ceutorhynchus assimilis]|uniref:Ankyrin repeat protein n=1 Tax=Ceutorhynchus assimilis TaxID=467358 RepID=A0A9P0DW41_9CUCU|nr:unnamed protein product [Ceutorhynchus assimilis]
MVDCVQIMRENSQAFLYNLKTTDFTLKHGTKGFLQENDGSILCLETGDVDVTRVLLAQVLINFKTDTILKEKLNEIIFTNFNSFIKLTAEENKKFLKNFPELLVCILDNKEQLLNQQSHILESWINIIKENGRKIIFIMKNSKHMEKTMMNNEMTNIFTLKLNELWKKNEILLTNNEALCEIENNLVNIESTSARALDECTDINLKEVESTAKTLSHDEATTKDADFKIFLQSLGLKQLDAIDENGNTQLHLAARDGKRKIVELLLVHDGAKKDIKNNDGKTSLHYAAENGRSAIVHLLLENGFNVNATDKYRNTPLHYASSNHNDTHLIEILLKFGAEIERKDKFGRTALHFASQNGHSAVVNSLLKNSADLNVLENNGDTPLHYATSNNKPEVVLLLLEHGALLNIENKQQQNVLNLTKKLKRTKRTRIIQILENHVITK